MYKNKLVKNSTDSDIAPALCDSDIAPALCEMITVCNVGEVKQGHGACMKSMSRANTRPEQYRYMYMVLITCFPELLLKGQVLPTTSLNSKVHKAKIGRNGKW